MHGPRSRTLFVMVVGGWLLGVSVLPVRAAGGGDLTDLSLESLMQVSIVGASRYEQRLSEAPSYVTVVTRDEIRRFGYRNLADVLRSIPGVYTTYDRAYSFAGVRGFSPPGDFNTRLLLIVDGHRINGNVYDQAVVGNDFPVDIDLVERVEFVRGPGSSVYGSNAFFGIVNVITRNGGTIDGAEASASAASHRTVQGRGSYGRKFGGGPEMLLSGTLSGSRGQDLYFPEYDAPETHDGISEDSDRERYWSLFGSAAWGDFRLEGVSGYRKKHLPTGQFETDFGGGGSYATDKAAYLDLRYEKELAYDLDVTARLFWDEYRYDGNNLYDALVNQDAVRGTWWGGEIQARKKVAERHILSVGAEYRANLRQDQKNYDVDPYDVVLDDRRKSFVWSAFLQGDFHLLRNLILTLGGRYDGYETFGGRFSPRAALIWSPRETTTVKALYGSAYRVPNVYELYYTDGVSLAPNPELKPETIDTYEIVLEQFWSAFGVTWKGTAAGYRYRIKNLIAAQSDETLPGFSVYRNSDPIDANGLEIELEGKTAGGYGGRASYGIQRASEKGGGGVLPNSPMQTAKLKLAAPFFRERIVVGPEIQYFSERRTTPGKSTESLGGYTLVNLTLLAQKIVTDLELSASVYNLFDKNYGEPVGEDFLQDAIPQDGRSYRLKMTYRF